MSGGGRAEVARIARGLLAEADAVADEMFTAICTQSPEWRAGASEQLQSALLASCKANINTGCERLAGDLSVPSVPPEQARRLAGLSAQLEIPLATLLRSYRIGYSLMLKRCYADLESAELSPRERGIAVQVIFDYLFDYVDRISSFITDAYTEERDRRVRSREQQRAQMVREILAGGAIESQAAQELLGYDLSLHHLACIACGSRPEQAIRKLARSLNAPHRMLVTLGAEQVGAWLGRARAFPPGVRPAADPACTLYIGDPAAGIAGFRQSHRQALEAQRVGACRRPGAVSFDEVALEALASADGERAHDFVRRELGALDADEPRGLRLRETLDAYFRSAQNAAAAAARLGVHEHTVTYRLRTIEELLGRSVTGRRAELETALRLRFVLRAQSRSGD